MTPALAWSAYSSLLLLVSFLSSKKPQTDEYIFVFISCNSSFESKLFLFHLKHERLCLPL